jgi:hypothetical protein
MSMAPISSSSGRIATVHAEVWIRPCASVAGTRWTRCVPFLVARYGVFGATPDPLSAVFLIPLGLPWIFAGDLLPLPLQPYFSLVSPLINLGILFGLASLAGRWKARRPSR